MFKQWPMPLQKMQKGFFEFQMDFPIITNHNPLYLASGSERRRRLLEQLRLPFRSLPSDVEEDLSDNERSFGTLRLAERKARSILPLSRSGWVLGADTVVVLENEILGKPKGYSDALSTLSRLSGKEHTVITGFCLLDPLGKTAHAEAVETLVRFRSLTAREVEAYIATGEPFGKAGSYAIQGIGAFMVERITGSYTNVVGLPVCALIKALLAKRALQAFPLAQPLSAAGPRRE
jgi:septum formation protein